MKEADLYIDSNYKFEHFFELSADLCCIAGFDGYFKRINPAVSELLGYTEDELFSRPINEFVYSEDQKVTEMVRNELRKNKPLLNFENRYLTKNGEIVWLSWTSMPVYEEKLVFAIAKDITQRKLIEEERNALLANLTKVNQDFRQFAYLTSHNLRSPLNSLLAIFSLLDTEKIKDSQTIQLIELLKVGSENLKKTLNDYVDLLSKKHRLNEYMEEIDFDQSLQNVLNTISSLMQTSKAVVNSDFSELKAVHFNKAYLESIFLNLITNSIKYCKPDCAPVISIYTKSVDNHMQLIISDNGIGFDMEKVRNRIFGLNQKFHDHIDSKGIGLYLVYNHVTSLGGRIEVESNINEGTKFLITFRNSAI